MSGLSQSRWAPSAPRPDNVNRKSTSSRASGSISTAKSDPGRVQNGLGNGFSVNPHSSSSPSSNTDMSTSTITNSTTTTKTSPSITASQELSRFTKLVARLRWKLPFLEEGYRLATQSGSGTPSTDAPMDTPYAETMFKIDFHEYYALLERAIVHLLSVFGVQVTSTPVRKWRGKKTGQGVQWNTTAPIGPGPSGASRATHSYHANVLETLEDPECPLYEVLGCGSVREQLRKAKELRNRWKTADEEQDVDRWGRQRAVLPLESYDFDQILSEIFGGLEDGYLLAQAQVKGDGDGAEREVEMEMEMDGGWDFIVEAMDWEAV
ncbi:hypothetical protein P170DRAFT_436911 [Aspergillus steynii IBT 23096]|uniref:Uncharacterized protein n=1 Tax=Aspergillus steynii IBT 23096 TaxID=1392250 RepID=A0A2I2G8V5_9EURO|nr:uncharacterized protein P170DRAFT_436911 [Aspergillus steynii IBT 23096]PLB49309.1 hypothetical protein P170DRAFT_436911 [Aspergillus steynii IBT 23096]